MIISARLRLRRFGRKWFNFRILGVTFFAWFLILHGLAWGEANGCGTQNSGWWCGASSDHPHEKRSTLDLWKGKYLKKIHLLQQWYFPKHATRAKELVRVLKLNTENQYIDHIHFLQPVENREEPRNMTGRVPNNASFYHSNHQAWMETFRSQLLDIDQEFPWSLFVSKLVVAPVSDSDRLLVSDALRYANDRLRHQGIALLANLDIYFDKSLIGVFSEESDLDYHTSFFLSRFEESPEAEADSLIGTQCGPKFVGSHDAIVFVPHLPGKLIGRCEFEIGSWGIENRILWEFEQAGLRGRNPCLDIRTWHVHWAGADKGWMPMVNTDGKSSVAFPDRLVSQFKSDYPWEVQQRAESEEAKRIQKKNGQ